MTKILALDQTWERAQGVAQQLHRDLGIDESDGRCMMHRVDGQTRHGWRVALIRRSDGVTATRFVAD